MKVAFKQIKTPSGAFEYRFYVPNYKIMVEKDCYDRLFFIRCDEDPTQDPEWGDCPFWHRETIFQYSEVARKYMDKWDYKSVPEWRLRELKLI